MNKLIIALTAFSLFLFSCKKNEEERPIEKTKMEALATKFNLNSVTNVPKGISAVSYNTVADLEMYLKSKTVKPVTTKIPMSTGKGVKNKVLMIGGGNNSAGDGIGSTTKQGDWLTGPVTYTATIWSEYFRNNQYPYIYGLSWTTDQNTTITDVKSTISYSGWNFGSWTYNHLSGSGSGGYPVAYISTSGHYTEYYGVGGVFTYSKVWKLDIGAQFLNGNVTATITYQEL